MKDWKFSTTSMLAVSLLLLAAAIGSSASVVGEHSYLFSGVHTRGNCQGCAGPGVTYSIRGHGSFSESGSATGNIDFLIAVGGEQGFQSRLTCGISGAAVRIPFTKVTLGGVVIDGTSDFRYASPGDGCSLTITQGTTPTTGTIIDDSVDGTHLVTLFRELGESCGGSSCFAQTVIVRID